MILLHLKCTIIKQITNVLLYTLGITLSEYIYIILSHSIFIQRFRQTKKCVLVVLKKWQLECNWTNLPSVTPVQNTQSPQPQCLLLQVTESFVVNHLMCGYALRQLRLLHPPIELVQVADGRRQHQDRTLRKVNDLLDGGAQIGVIQRLNLSHYWIKDYYLANHYFILVDWYLELSYDYLYLDLFII